jgi:alkanesulfonate monooxygenase
VFSTCPHSTALSLDAHLRRVVEVARWSEQAGCKGVLIYTDNSTLDPWMIAQVVIQNTQALCPLVAVQPVYLHPYTVAKLVATLGHLYGRRVYLNMVAGGFKNDLTALNDPAPHDRRYDRLIEYTTVIKGLLAGAGPLSFDGEFYKTDKLRLAPPLRPELFPGLFVSGSSEAGRVAARKLGAVAVHYPKPPGEHDEGPAEGPADTGIRVGVIAREDSADAWRAAYERFPPDRKGQLTHQLAMKTSDSAWHKQLSELGEEAAKPDNPYWLHPFQNYQTFCPYLVGSYAEVARELTRYLAAGHRSVILDIPPCQEELRHARAAFDLACGRGAA